MEYKELTIKGVGVDSLQLENYLEKLASDQVLQDSSKKNTYPIPKVKENFELIKEVYFLLNEHIKLGLPIHPAGEWLLDNFYIIEETVKNICKNLSLQKYKKFLGIRSGSYQGFARIYVLAAQIVAYTDNKIDAQNLIEYLKAYQRKKTLSMEEIWNIGTFIQIAILQNIREICEKIYFSQMQKYRVENIIERLVENKEELKYKNLTEYKARVKGYGEMKYPFIEYMSYRLKQYGKSAYGFMAVLEEQVNKMGTSVEEVIQKEHFDIAVKKVSMANCITSMKELTRVDFLAIFEKINGVEEILRKDPAKVYEKMDYKTKEYYRNTIQEIGRKTKISELYIAKKVLELATKEKEEGAEERKTHIGYFLIDEGIPKLYESLNTGKKRKFLSQKAKVCRVIGSMWLGTFVLTILASILFYMQTHSVLATILFGILAILPIQEMIRQVVHHVTSKSIKPKLIPKLDFQNGITEENATMVVIPTIIKSKEKVKELMHNLEVMYLANKSEHFYFALLGDCSSSQNEKEAYDEEVIEEGKLQVERLNQKYPQEGIEKFQYIYRKRYWNGKEECYLGWERKRGLLNQLNEYLLGHEKNMFLYNSMEEEKTKGKKWKEQIRYIITLDADTKLPIGTGLELIGAMSHILNRPILNQTKDAVVQGHGIMQPRVGIDLEISRKNLFTQIFAGSGGTDSYTNAISDFYQDLFDEGIFTGKGIYDLATFSTVLANEIPENKVLSHDLLEGSYLRCGLASDIMLMDGYPTSYQSFKARMHRWIRGDIQILGWLKSKIFNKKGEEKQNPLNALSKYKILDNSIRALFPITVLLGLLYTLFFSSGFAWLFFISLLTPTLLDILDKIIYRKENVGSRKSFDSSISTGMASVSRGILLLAALPDKAYTSANAIVKTCYRLWISKKHMLEWITSEEAEKLAKTSLVSCYKNMLVNIIVSVGVMVYLCITKQEPLSILFFLLAIVWLIAPGILWYMSKTPKVKTQKEMLSQEETQYLMELGKETWQFFKTYLTAENHYLPPDNYQEDRSPIVVSRTSSTNIGLGMLAVISSYDLGYETLEDTVRLLLHMIATVEEMPKWNGHLYNWYDIHTLQPLTPRYVSTVDSGNFVGYVYIVKTFLADVLEKRKVSEDLLEQIPAWVKGEIGEIPIARADFSKLYDEEKKLFSIGFHVDNNQLTDSYYDLLASEARQTSFVAIAKKDVSPKHWFALSRTLTSLNGYKGLVSWSGTAFEYLMPNINMKKYKGSLLEESCLFMLMSQKEYSQKLGVPWGFSETAFHVKDFSNNYQYKAIGIPWLGLKRGLEDDIVVASYGTLLALPDQPKEVLQNIKLLEQNQMRGKYGLYESIDYTPARLHRGQNYAVVKTYMAHHQALILLSINNLFSDGILQKRFEENPEIEAIDILLQERMPESMIITKEQKEKPTKIKYRDYADYCERIYEKPEMPLKRINAISSNDYLIVMDQKGQGYSKYKDILVNRFKETKDTVQGILFYFKNIRNKRIWTSGFRNDLGKPDRYQVIFSEDRDKIVRLDGSIETITEVTISSDSPVEIRRVTLENRGAEEETIEISSVLEPVISQSRQDNAHPAFNNLFLRIEKEDDIFVIKRRKHTKEEQDMYMAVTMQIEGGKGDLEFEVDKEKLNGRGNLGIPEKIESSKPFSKKLDFAVDPILAMRRTISLAKEGKAQIYYVLTVGETKETVIERIKEYQNKAKLEAAFKLSRARVEAENRYLGVSAKQIEEYQNMLSYLLFQNPLKTQTLPKLVEKEEEAFQSKLWKYGISGDLPILLLKIEQVADSYVLKDILKAYNFYRSKHIAIDLVILNEEENSYENYVREEIQNCIYNENLAYMQNQKGGIWVLENVEEKEVLEARANLIIDSKKGPVARNLKDREEEYTDNKQDVMKDEQVPYLLQEEVQRQNLEAEKLKYYNEFGGFLPSQKEYQIKQNKDKRLPNVWSHMMANEHFGTLVTDSMGGFSWCENSRLNRLSSWANTPVEDIPSEVIYMKDEETKKVCSLGLNPMPDDNDYDAIYGFGYSRFMHTSSAIKQETTIFVPREDKVKIYVIHLQNLAPQKKKIKLVYYIKPVLGEDEEQTKGWIGTEFVKKANTILAKNYGGEIIPGYAYVTSSEEIQSYTGSKSFFIGNGSLQNPEAMHKKGLNGENSLGQEGIIAIEVEVNLEALEQKEISFVFGMEENKIQCLDKAYQYSNIQNCEKALEEVQRYWQETIQKLQVETPLESFNILMNGWMIYQAMVSRLWARSAYQQSGGALGFRDQLQDTLGLKYTMPEKMRNQIIKHSRHQFQEGDVEHWWHEETGRGIRTRFSDDLLWLVYLTEEYCKVTGDTSLLEEQTPFLEGAPLEEGEDERYDLYLETEETASIYEHCTRAIGKAMQFGENNLPKIGSGDWNDGLSTVGNKGKGESVWLGFFLYDILQRWIPVQEKQIEKWETEGKEELIEREKTYQEEYKKSMEMLKKALNTNAWDGRWFRRAFCDDGEILGTIQNEECKIDGISQSWATISGAGDNDKKYISLESLENHLVDKENGLIRLLDPPFEKSNLEPGYIKAYLPGTRENGGQYTHGAIWAIIAFSMLGFGDKALELFRMINPIEHARTKEMALKYKVEPYVIAADIYSRGNLAGRGGWTWYTGSASWMQVAGIEYILGLKIENEILKIEPCIPREWKEYKIEYRYGNSIYHIRVENPNGKSTARENMQTNGKVEKFLVNGVEEEDKQIKLSKEGGIYEIHIEL